MSGGDEQQLGLRALSPVIEPGEPSELVSSGRGSIRPRARLIRTIGAELISSEIVAIAELVRNSYDADASRVQIRFSDPHLQEQARLEIFDDGHGMSQEILLGPWLEPATDHKTENGKGFGGTRSPKGRRRLGSKGVGRFATQRLGSHLLLQTATEDAGTVLEADFDWESLDTPDRYLDELEIPWREMAGRDWHGTRLVLDKLRDQWTEQRFDRLRLSLSRLVGPGLGTDGFAIELVINGAVEEIKPSIEKMPAMYSLEGKVEEGGRCFLTYRDAAGGEEVWERSVVWPHDDELSCGPFKLKLNVWDLDREALEFYFTKNLLKFGLRDFRRMVRDHSGVSLYRDGFRILPYGEPDNDWLRLDRRRVNNPTLRLSNNQMLGTLQLAADSNPRLKDQTNREGLVSNESYSHLQQVVLELLGYLETRRFRSRREVGFGLKNDGLAAAEALNATAPEILATLDQLEGQDFLAAEDTVRKLRSLITENQATALGAVRQYADLAASGHLSSLVFTQLRHPVDQIRTEVVDLQDLVEDLDSKSDLKEDAVVGLGKIQRLLSRMAATMQKLDPLAVPRRLRQPVQTSVCQCAEEAVEAFSDRLVAAEIELAQRIKGEQPIETDPYVVQGALLFVLENAEYWLRQSQKGRRKINLTIYNDGFDIENNGPPIPGDAKNHIFEPYFTMREDAGGMGLALARDLLASVGGTIQIGTKRTWVQFKVRLS